MVDEGQKSHRSALHNYGALALHVALVELLDLRVLDRPQYFLERLKVVLYVACLHFLSRLLYDLLLY